MGKVIFQKQAEDNTWTALPEDAQKINETTYIYTVENATGASGTVYRCDKQADFETSVVVGRLNH